VIYRDDSTVRLAPDCSVRVQERVGGITLSLFGEYDIGCEAKFNGLLARLLNAETTELVVDLTALTFMDSTGLNALIHLDERATESGFDFVVLCGTGAVRRVLELTGLHEVLPVVDPSEPPAGAVAAPPLER